jgi:hypothetical protein
MVKNSFILGSHQSRERLRHLLFQLIICGSFRGHMVKKKTKKIEKPKNP